MMSEDEQNPKKLFGSSEQAQTELGSFLDPTKTCSLASNPPSVTNRLRRMLTLLQVPENYLRAIFGSFLASRFIYKCGINASQFAFFSL
jgi:glutamate dehydrogenase